MEWRDEIEEKSEMGLNEFVLWWVKGGTAARQPANKRNEQPHGAQQLFFLPALEETRRADEERERGGAVKLFFWLVMGAGSAKATSRKRKRALPNQLNFSFLIK